jgi:hypothetical protein
MFPPTTAEDGATPPLPFTPPAHFAQAKFGGKLIRQPPALSGTQPQATPRCFQTPLAHTGANHFFPQSLIFHPVHPVHPV